MNVYALVLAAGSGRRIKSSSIPKQYIKIKEKPLFIYCLEKFLDINEIDKIFLVINQEYEPITIKYINDWLKEQAHKIEIVYGGNSRNGSIARALKYLNHIYHFNSNDIFVTHDAARIFVDQKIILDSIYKSFEQPNILIDTCIKSNDSIAYSPNYIIKSVPRRDEFLIIQTPQTLNWDNIKNIYSKKYEEEYFENTDISSLAYINKIPIDYVYGSVKNFKITNDLDLEFADFLIRNHY